MLTEGPYYHTEGHPIRQNMAEDQLGFPFVRLSRPFALAAKWPHHRR